jgi:hypothetical protein
MAVRSRQWVIAAVCVFTASPSFAGEGGGSNYLQATYGDFQAAVWGPAGLYARDNLFYYPASIGVRPLGGKVALGVNEQVTANLATAAYLSDYTFLGARVGAAIAVPYVLNADVSGTGIVPAGAFGVFKAGSVSGLGDIFVSPVQLNWTSGNQHFTFSPGIVTPTGKCDPDNLLNVGRNYWSFDVSGSYTWFDPKKGTDISFTPASCSTRSIQPLAIAPALNFISTGS